MMSEQKTTKKLFYEFPTMLESDAVVVEVSENENGYLIVLNQSIFFPEAGGQPADSGYINKMKVLSVSESEGTIYHLVEKDKSRPPFVGETVELSVNRDLRIDHCCQHTGEHILSGLAKKLFDATNVGFHMSETYSTLDFDTELSVEAISKLENAANDVVLCNIPIMYRFVDREGLKSLSLRKVSESILDKAEEFRVVYIGDVDSCTCCGSHCNSSAEVGLIKITAFQKYKGGTRAWFLCGKRAFIDYCQKQELSDALKKRFSVKSEDVLASVIRQGDELSRQKHLGKRRMEKLSALFSEKLISEGSHIGKTLFVCYKEVDKVNTIFEAKALSESLLAAADNIFCALFFVNGDTVSYCLSAKNTFLNMGELAGTVNLLFGGKGGGNSCFAQGSAPYKSNSQFEQCVSQFEEYVSRLS